MPGIQGKRTLADDTVFVALAMVALLTAVVVKQEDKLAVDKNPFSVLLFHPYYFFSSSSISTSTHVAIQTSALADSTERHISSGFKFSRSASPFFH